MLAVIHNITQTARSHKTFDQRDRPQPATPNSTHTRTRTPQRHNRRSDRAPP